MIVKNLTYIQRESAPYRNKFGFISGLLVWFSARQNYKRPRNNLYDIRIPSLGHDVSLRAGTSDLMVFEQIICSGETDFDLSFNPQFIIDAGANIGLSSIMIAAKYPDCRIVSLEVDSSNFELLCKNTVRYPNIIPLKKALWDHDGHVKISNPSSEPWAFRVEESKPSDPESIEAISLGSLLKLYGEKEFSLLKIDIEGSELDLFKSTDLNWIDHTKVIAIELHDRIRPGCTRALEKVLEGRQYKERQQGEYRIIYF